MIHRRALKGGLVLALAGAALVPACGRRKYAEANDITPSVKVNRLRTPLGSPIEITYTWTLGPTAKKLGQDYRAFVHFLEQLSNEEARALRAALEICPPDAQADPQQ